MMFTHLHSVLARQLTKSGYNEQDLVSDERLATLISKVNISYEDADKGRYLKERALELSSIEMQELYNTISAEKDELKKLVNELVEKDKALLDKNEQLIIEVSERGRAQEKAIELNEQLVIAARRAGMADIATSTLHNIGNILNSINTSIGVISEKITHSEMDTLTELAKLFEKHNNDFNNFILEDSRGKNIPKFLPVIIHAVENERTLVASEIDELTKNVEHIRNIITVQQTMSTAIGLTEEVSIESLLEDALKLGKTSYEKVGIKVIRRYNPIQKVVIDKVKLLQVIVNLIKNAVDALLESPSSTKKLIVEISEKNKENFIIKIIDSGIGITADNLNKIFTYGFTTKKNGHGFGLHSSANAVREMKGELFVESDGKEKGTTFTLILPYNLPITNKDI